MDIAFSEGERERDRERTEREGRRETGIYSVTFTLISGKWSGHEHIYWDLVTIVYAYKIQHYGEYFSLFYNRSIKDC